MLCCIAVNIGTWPKTMGEIIWIHLLSLGFLVFGSEVTWTAWMAKTEFSGKLFENNINWSGYVKTRLQCFRICSNDMYSKTLFYNSEDKTCHCNAAETDTAVVLSPGTVAYQRGHESFRCPDPYRFYSAPSNVGLSFRIVFDEHVDQATAKMRCENQNASLVIIDAINKQKYLANVLQNCPGYGVQDYWIDGYDVVGDNRSYKWRDGRNMTMDDVIFWATGKPNANIERCVRMQGTAGYRWNDNTCDQIYGYICEL